MKQKHQVQQRPHSVTPLEELEAPASAPETAGRGHKEDGKPDSEEYPGHHLEGEQLFLDWHACGHLIGAQPKHIENIPLQGWGRGYGVHVEAMRNDVDDGAHANNEPDCAVELDGVVQWDPLASQPAFPMQGRLEGLHSWEDHHRQVQVQHVAAALGNGIGDAFQEAAVAVAEEPCQEERNIEAGEGKNEQLLALLKPAQCQELQTPPLRLASVLLPGNGQVASRHSRVERGGIGRRRAVGARYAEKQPPLLLDVGPPLQLLPLNHFGLDQVVKYPRPALLREEPGLRPLERVEGSRQVDAQGKQGKGKSSPKLLLPQPQVRMDDRDRCLLRPVREVVVPSAHHVVRPHLGHGNQATIKISGGTVQLLAIAG
mmetsp:Transcript_88340/g.258208  ORF Transcript_88340/g.258208 Transcript_88340/m.258208 type:complete len:372 (-) Transcript_88340:1707-2822(-)